MVNQLVTWDSIVFWTCRVLVCLSQVSQGDEEELNGEVWKPFEAWWVVDHRCIEWWVEPGAFYQEDWTFREVWWWGTKRNVVQLRLGVVSLIFFLMCYSGGILAVYVNPGEVQREIIIVHDVVLVWPWDTPTSKTWCWIGFKSTTLMTVSHSWLETKKMIFRWCMGWGWRA